MLFIVDEDVPKSASDFLVEYAANHGHAVTLVPDVLLPGSDDHLIAKWAHENLAIVVTCNVRHFQALLQRATYS
jgi:predicted nucleic acid-binding protein